MPFQSTERKSLWDWLFDAACVASVFGIWPRFIEPKILCVSRQQVSLPSLPATLDGLRLLLLSDLHLCKYSSERFLKKVRATVEQLSPHLIVFAGDALCCASFVRKDLAAICFSNLSAPLGTFACLGNHDYAAYVPQGQDPDKAQGHQFLQGLRRLLSYEKCQYANQAPLPLNDSLVEFYKTNGITLLNNEAVQIGQGDQLINLVGLGDFLSGHFLPYEAFRKFDRRFPGIVFGHNPDCYQFLAPFPGDLFLFGHTHGGQVNLPYLWKRITPLLDPSLKSGLYLRGDRTIFVSRGIGATFPFRLFCPPQLALLTLSRGGKIRANAFAGAPMKLPAFSVSPLVASKSELPYDAL